MRKSLRTDAYVTLRETLANLRARADVSQRVLSERLGRPQPFISKIERGERGIDVIEFYAVARALGIEPRDAFDELVRRLPPKVDI